MLRITIMAAQTVKTQDVKTPKEVSDFQYFIEIKQGHVTFFKKCKNFFIKYKDFFLRVPKVLYDISIVILLIIGLLYISTYLYIINNNINQRRELLQTKNDSFQHAVQKQNNYKLSKLDNLWKIISLQISPES